MSQTVAFVLPLPVALALAAVLVLLLVLSVVALSLRQAAPVRVPAGNDVPEAMFRFDGPAIVELAELNTSWKGKLT